MRVLIWAVLGYLSGSILYAYELPRRISRVDVMQGSGDGNPGTANAFLQAGSGVGILVLVCELMKGFLPVWLASMRLPVHSLSFAAVLAAPVLGHAYPIFYDGKGGKAIAVSFGVLLGLAPAANAMPLIFLVFFYLLFSLVIVLRPNSRRSIVTFFCFGTACVLCVKEPGVMAGCLAVAVVVIHKHRLAQARETAGGAQVQLGRVYGRDR